MFHSVNFEKFYDFVHFTFIFLGLYCIIFGVDITIRVNFVLIVTFKHNIKPLLVFFEIVILSDENRKKNPSKSIVLKVAREGFIFRLKNILT